MKMFKRKVTPRVPFDRSSCESFCVSKTLRRSLLVDGVLSMNLKSVVITR